MMHSYLLQKRNSAAAWKAASGQCKSPQQIAAYRQRVRGDVLNCLWRPARANAAGGPGYRRGFPPGLSRGEDHLSEPAETLRHGLAVPARRRAIFQPPYPGVLVPCGHWIQAKGRPSISRSAHCWRSSGMAALVFDPIDEGEQGQYLGRATVGRTLALATAHNNVGIGCILLGQNAPDSKSGTACGDRLSAIAPEMDPNDRLHGQQRRGHADQLSDGPGRPDRLRGPKLLS